MTILKTTKLGPRESNKHYDVYIKILPNLTNILTSTSKMSKKNKIKKNAWSFL